MRFYAKEDYAHVLEEGLWIVLRHYLTVNRWKPNFRPLMETISSTMIWCQLPDLPIEFFNDDLLMRVGNYLGKAVKVDDTTRETLRGRFA